ncbi:MAG: hypothetical protein KGZ25_05610, partial [Planctomycetes bacterium]|nr:hypothetical protein [Planctomycetota bacterium]
MKKAAFVAFFGLLVSVSSAAQPEPSLLFCSPRGLAAGYVDLTYIKELHDAGFEVDYTEGLDKLTADRIRQYNVLVLYTCPNKQLAKRILKYVAGGGGILLIPTEHNINKQRLYDITEPLGADLPVERIKETDPAKKGLLSHGARGVPLAYTSQIPPSPVSKGVKGIWYPTSPAYNASHTGPLAVGKPWLVVLRGSKTSKTVPVNLSESNTPDLLDPFIREAGVKEPVFFAIRPFKKGRVALVNQWRQYSIGSGTKWIYNREVLSKGIKGRPSDFGKLLRNTYRWLAEPSMKSGAVGGYETEEEVFVPPNRRENAQKMFQYTFWWWEYEMAQWHRPPKFAPLFRGLIGAKSRFSTGEGTIEEYRDAARGAGLRFVVFLEDFPELTGKEFDELKKRCAELSDDQVLLVPGYNILNNIGDHMFFFGTDPIWPPDYCLTGPDKKTFALQREAEGGGYTGHHAQSFNWLLKWSNARRQSGYYHFSDNQPGQRLPDQRASAMTALRYYRRGKLIEDVTDLYPLTTQGTLPPSPVSVNEVYSPAGLVREAGSGNALTYVQARKHSTIFRDGLRWSHQYDGLNVFLSDGPLIRAWPFCYRVMTLGSEAFVTKPTLMPSLLSVTSDRGLKEVRIYNGRNLFRRFDCGGAKKFQKTLLLDGVIQKNLVLVAEDTEGHSAVSTPRRCWKSGGRAVVFCGDHVNDCKSGGMILGRGPVSLISHWVVPLPPDIAGNTWDGGPPGSLPLVTFGESRPVLETETARESGSRFRQVPLLEFSDEGAAAASSWHNALYAKSIRRPVNPWHTFGPVDGPSDLMEFTLRYREWLTPTIGAPQAGWAGPGVRHGINACLFRSEISFRSEATIKKLQLLYNYSDPRTL